MIIEALIILFLYFLGLRLSNNLLDIKLQSLVAFPMALIIWVLFYLLIRIIFINDTFITYNDYSKVVYAFMFIASVAIFIDIVYSRNLKILLQNIFLSLIVFLISLILLNLNLPVVMSQDSYTLVDIFYNYEKSLAGGYPLFLTSIQVLSVCIGEDYFLSAYIYLIAFNFYLLISYFMFHIINKLDIENIYKVIISASVPLFIILSFMGIYQSFYINHHLFVSLMYLLSSILFYKYLDNKNIIYIYFGLFFIISTILMRMEIVIFSYIFILVFYSHKEIDKKIFFQLLLFYSSICTIWLGYFINILPDQSFIDPNQYFLIIASMWFGLLFLYVINKFNYTKKYFYLNLDKIILYILSMILIVLIFIKPSHMFEGIINIIINMFYERHGAWGFLWFLIFLLIIYISIKDSGKIEYKELFYFFFISIIILLIVMYFRAPYRVGLGDSMNRMLLHFMPLILLFAFYNSIRIKLDR